MYRPDSIARPIKPETTAMIFELDSVPLAQRDRLLGTLASLLYAEDLGKEDLIKTIYGQLESIDSLDIDRINILRIRTAVMIARGNSEMESQNQYIEFNPSVKKNLATVAEEQIIITTEDLITKFAQSEDTDTRETVIKLLQETTDLARHLDVGRDTWLKICELQEPYEDITGKTMVGKLPPPKLSSEFFVAA